MSWAGSPRAGTWLFQGKNSRVRCGQVDREMRSTGRTQPVSQGKSGPETWGGSSGGVFGRTRDTWKFPGQG